MFCASVIICTHNPRPVYLSRVLAGLRNQTLSLDSWELLLIDNASKEPLTPESWDISWHPQGRHIREGELGLSSARLRGIREASSDLLVFVDDDNVLEPNYLLEAIRIKREWPLLGVWGSGATFPEFEIEPADNLREFLGMLALRVVDSARWSNVFQCDRARPFGAGMCVRANVAMAYREHFIRSAIEVSDRRSAALSGGGDNEICYVACDTGLGVGIFPELKLTHLIPKERVSADYLVRLAEGTGFTRDLLAYKWEKIVPASHFAGPLGLLHLLKNLLTLKGIRRRLYVAGVRSRLRARKFILKHAEQST
jgi:glycosyltransferase involved in cell wall biosynthesis